MSLIDYEDFVFDSCLQDWDKLGKFIDKVLNVFRKAKKVHLIGENVDLRFDIHGTKAAADKGEENIYTDELNLGKKINIRINNKNDILKLKHILTSSKGNNAVYLIVENKKIKTKFSIDDSAEIKSKIVEIVGNGNLFEEV